LKRFMPNKCSFSKFIYKRLHWAAVVLVLIVSFSIPAFGDETNGTITGQVFIVTKAADNVRLGLVKIMLFPEEAITNYVADRNKQINDDRPDFDKQIADFDKSILEMKENLEKIKATEEKLRTLGTDVSPINRPGIQSVEGFIALLEQQRESKLEAKQNWPASSHYFKDLPTSLSSTRTDADGKFSLQIPKSGRFAIAAHASRKTYSANEEYYWMVWVSLNGRESTNIILGNQNLMSSGSQESVVSTKSD
jgi:hypothetical protein